jgi:hypothetical protein
MVELSHGPQDVRDGVSRAWNLTVRVRGGASIRSGDCRSALRVGSGLVMNSALLQRLLSVQIERGGHRGADLINVIRDPSINRYAELKLGRAGVIMRRSVEPALCEGLEATRVAIADMQRMTAALECGACNIRSHGC